METIRKIELDNGKSVEFHYSTGDSREWDNMTKMICFHSRYNLGDKHEYSHDDYDSWDEMKKAIVKEENAAIIQPLYLYDHSGITISTSPFSCKWDSGQVGFIIVSKNAIRAEYGLKRISKKAILRAESVVKAEVETYDMEITGEVFGFACYDEKGNMTDSCGGFYGSDLKENGMLDNIEDEDILKRLETEDSVYK